MSHDTVRILLPALFLALLTVLPGGPTTAQTVEGRLLESGTARPIAFGIVTLADTTGQVATSVMTDTTGRFVLEAPRPGVYLVVGGGLGYTSHADGVELGDGGYLQVDFYLRPRPVELPGLLAVVERVRIERYLDGQGFYDRREMGFGHFIGPEELEERQPVDAQDLLRGVPSIRVGDAGFAGQTITCRGGSPRLYVDGVRIGFPPIMAIETSEAVELEQAVDMDAIAAVEVFTRASQLPLRFNGTGTPCVILVWTKGRD